MINWAKFSPYKGKKFSLEDSGKQLLALGGVSLLGWKLGCDLCPFVGWISRGNREGRERLTSLLLCESLEEQQQKMQSLSQSFAIRKGKKEQQQLMVCGWPEKFWFSTIDECLLYLRLPFIYTFLLWHCQCWIQMRKWTHDLWFMLISKTKM